VLAFVAMAFACGKRGDPLPPLPRIPQPVTSLKVSQRGESLEVSYVAPRTTAGGVRLGVLDVEVLRADSTGEVPKGDFQKAARRERYRAAPGESRSETLPLPPLGTTVRVAARALDHGRASNLSPVATLVVQSPPTPPHDLVAELHGEEVVLHWQGTLPSPPPSPAPSPSPSASPSPSSPAPSSRPPSGRPGLLTGRGGPPRPPASPSPKASVRGFFVYRRADPGGHYGDILYPAALDSPGFEDKMVALGQRWCYVVATVVSTEPVVESARSNEACLAVRDIVPPARPVGVTALGGPEGIEVSWSPSPEPDLALYRVYRAGEGGAPARLAEVTPPETTFHDPTAAKGTKYAYTVTAVDRAGNESVPSGPAPGSRP